MAEKEPDDGTIGKALDLLDKVVSFERPVRFSEILAQSHHPKATLYRLVRSLTNQGMLVFDADDRTYRPGLRLVRLAHAAWAQSSIAPIARPALDALSARTGHTIHLAKLDGGHVLYLDKRKASQPIAMFSEAGKIGPAYCTGLGKAMLAFLDEPALEHAMQRQAFYGFMPNTLTSAQALRKELEVVRDEGVAFDRSEHEPGIICVAAPILTRQRRVLGGVSISTSSERHSLDDLAALAPELLETVAAIAADVEAWIFPEPIRPGPEKGLGPCPE